MVTTYRLAFLGGSMLIAVGVVSSPWVNQIGAFLTTIGVMISFAQQLFRSPPSVAFSRVTGRESFSTSSPQQDTLLEAYRWSGVAILIGGLLNGLIALGNLITPRSFLLISALQLLQLLQGAAMIFGLPGFYAKFGNGAGKLGAVGVIVLIGAWIIIMCKAVLQLANFHGLLDIHGPLVGGLSAIQFYSSTIGSILLSISMIRAAVYPRWTGVALLIGASVYLIIGGSLLPVNPNVAWIISALFPLIPTVVYIRCAFTLLESDREFAIPT